MVPYLQYKHWVRGIDEKKENINMSGEGRFLIRLDTAGVERNPPWPTISLATLLAAAI
jgi:hypothetical protein